MAPSEHSYPTTASPEDPKSTELQGSHLKSNHSMMKVAFKEEISISLIEIKKKNPSNILY